MFANETRPGPPAESLPVAEPLPLPIVPDWEEKLRRAEAAARLIDRHLDYEERGRRLSWRERLKPVGLCLEQRTQLLTDLYAITR
ncbi:MAG: hypothetical protein HY320_02335 [Armatimonadetes bacterium]|nr:hypothetical protein [Armatimonadota bacterium]